MALNYNFILKNLQKIILMWPCCHILAKDYIWFAPDKLKVVACDFNCKRV